MKTIIKLVTIIILILLTLTSCQSQNEQTQLDNNEDVIQADNYAEVIKLGLKSEQLNESDMLIKYILENDEEIIYITRGDAIGIIYISRIDDLWTWKRTSVFKTIESDSLNYSYQPLELETIKGHKYYSYFGKTFDNNINRVAFEYQNSLPLVSKVANTFFFSIHSKEKLIIIDTTAYDSMGNIIPKHN